LHRKERDGALRSAASDLAEGVVAFAALGTDVTGQALPIETAFEEHEPAGGREGKDGSVEILLIVEIGFANEGSILGVLADLGTVEKLQNAAGAQAGKSM
jgi:hypothetical protein